MHATQPVFFTTEQRGQFLGRADVGFVRCQYAAQHYYPELFTEQQIVCPPDIVNSVVKRKAEYLAGRYCAQQALAQLGFENPTIATGDKRQPLWPEGIIGTISHTHLSAVCLVSRAAALQGIGIDQELVLSSSVIDEIAHQIINPAESCLLKRLKISYHLAFTLAFSAKESFFKAMFPLYQDYFDFDAVSLTDLVIDKSSGEFKLRLNQHFNDDFPQGKQVIGYFTYQNEMVETAVLLR